jgi:hypothetical protein
MLARFGWSVLVAVGLASPGWADSPVEGEVEGEGYLATGDSVPFGFNPLVDFRNPANFVGYPQQVRDEVGLEPYLNTACPGETSGSFLSPFAPDNGCRAFKANFPLHDGFHPNEIQVVRDVGYLLRHQETRLVTVMLGANDSSSFKRPVWAIQPVFSKGYRPRSRLSAETWPKSTASSGRRDFKGSWSQFSITIR